MKDLKNFRKILIGVVLVLLVIAAVGVLTNSKKEVVIPYMTSNITVTSTANGVNNSTDTKNRWNIDIYQNNDIYINVDMKKDIEKINEMYIKSLYIDNFVVNTNPKLGSIKKYKLSEDSSKLFSYEDKYVFEKRLDFKVVDKDANIYNGEINKSGGQIALAIVNHSIGNFTSNTEKTINFDGTLISKAKISTEDIKFSITFDINIIDVKNRKYKQNIKLDLPYGNISEEGFCLNKEIDTSILKFEVSK